MGVQITFGLLAGLTGVLVLVRIFWLRIPGRLRRLMVACAVIIPFVFVIGLVTRWRTPSLHMDYGFYWLCIVSYIFLMILFTRLRPRWLTTIIAVVLILPLLSTSLFLPLVYIFGIPSVETSRIGKDIVSERSSWGPGAPDVSGTDLVIYYEPRWLPFMRRSLFGIRYYGSQCDAWAAHAVIEPDQRNVLMICPASPRLGPDSARSAVVPLYPLLF